MKKAIGIIISSLSFLMFLSLYFIVVLCKGDYIKYIITIMGYLSIVGFTVGIFIFQKNRKEKGEHINESKNK